MTTLWKRLEVGSVGTDLDEGLRCQIADPMWLLARQWQSGEFHGEDAASPVLVTARVGHSMVSHFHTGDGSWSDLSTVDLPLEVLVEREGVQASPGGTRHNLDAGLMFLRMLDIAGLGTHKADFRGLYPVVLPQDDGNDPVGRRMLDFLAPRSLNAYGLRDAITQGSIDWTQLPGLTPAQAQPVFDAFVPWMDAHLSEPSATTANGWDAQRMEYQFALTAPTKTGRVALQAKEYTGGHLDWYSFDIDPDHDHGTLTPVMCNDN